MIMTGRMIIDCTGIIAMLLCILGIITMFIVIDFSIGWVAPISAYAFIGCGYFACLNKELTKKWRYKYEP